MRYRKKMYEYILEFPLNLPLILKPQTGIQEVSKRIEEFCKEYGGDLNVKLDYRPAIRPVGIKLDDIIDWLTSPIIYDTRDGKVKPLKEVYKAYFQDLVRYTIVFRIFVDKEKSKKYPHIVDKIKGEAKKELEGLDKKLETFSS